MDASVSPQLDGSLKDSDGEENHSDDSSSSADPAQVSVEGGSPGVTVVQLSDGQMLQVHGVIQAPQTSVIQAPSIQTVQIASVAELEPDQSEADTQKRRVLLSRRPSYRKILNELSSDSPAVAKIEEEKMEEEAVVVSAAEATVPTSIYQTSAGQYIAISQGRAIQLNPGVEALQGGGAQTLTVGSSYPTGDAQQQIFIQGGQMLLQAATGDIPAYQLRSPNSGLAHSIMMAASPDNMQSPPPPHTEAITLKREVRLMKNREAARECRRKKKEYVKCLENRVAVLENQNKTLIEELKALKDIYCHKAE
ncbi:hypothetical protein OYC64_018351 [Pagothenia borchgrevinki]|uniref:cAMP-responsive element modulator-like n=1 Tax=Pagothenia borchgrevinki TaxID=8213 RepID=A0ABD2GNG0_PAGBO